MVLAVNNAATPSIGTGLTLSNCTYPTSKGSFGTTAFRVKGTMTNNTNDSIGHVYFFVTETSSPLPKYLLQGYTIANFGKGVSLKPGESGNFEINKEMLNNTGYFGLIMTDYYTTDGSRVVIPLADYVEVSCTKT